MSEEYKRIIGSFDEVVETVYEALLLMGYIPTSDDAEVIASLVISYTSELIDIAVENVLGDEKLDETIRMDIDVNEINDLERVYTELQKQEAIAYSLRKRITSLRGELKFERQKNAKLEKRLREYKKRDHYRNGQKRGRNGRNG